MGSESFPHIYVDADACSVKSEIFRVAERYELGVTLVANSWMRIPDEDWIELVIVGDGLDEADDWIAERVEANEIVITADIPLAAQCLEKGAYVLGQKGRVFDQKSIGDALAGRQISSQLRELGRITGGPAPFTQKDRSRFLQRLDEAVHACRKAAE